MWLVAAAMLAQTLILPSQGYLIGPSTQPELATIYGRYAVEWGHNCQDLKGEPRDVEVYFVLNIEDQAALAPLDDSGQVETVRANDSGGVESQMCSVLITPVSDVPCAQLHGVCVLAQDQDARVLQDP